MFANHAWNINVVVYMYLIRPFFIYNWMTANTHRQAKRALRTSVQDKEQSRPTDSADPTGRQTMFTPLWHLTLPLIFRNPCLLCSCFVSFIWTFDFKHCSSHVIHQDNFSSITYPSTRSAMPKVVILSDTIYGFVRFVDSIFEYCTRLVRTKRAIKCIHSFVLCQET